MALMLLTAAVLMQCYATRTDSRCQPFAFYLTMAECRRSAAEYQHSDSKALIAANAPIVVSYRCLVETR